MESIFTTVAPTVMSGTDLGLAIVHALLENIWRGGLLLGVCLLIFVLKLPAMLVLPLILSLAGGLMFLIAAGQLSALVTTSWLIVIFGELRNEADLRLKAFIICPGLAT